MSVLYPSHSCIDHSVSATYAPPNFTNVIKSLYDIIIKYNRGEAMQNKFGATHSLSQYCRQIGDTHSTMITTNSEQLVYILYPNNKVFFSFKEKLEKYEKKYLAWVNGGN